MSKVTINIFIGFLLCATLGLVPVQADTAGKAWFQPHYGDSEPGALQTDTLYLPVLLAGSSCTAPEELSPEERVQAIADITASLESLSPAPGTSPDQRNLVAEVELMGTALLEVPDVIATLVQRDTLTVNAVLSDGLVITIINNRPPGADDTQPSVSQLRERLTAQLAGQQVVPGSSKAVVANFDGGGAEAAEVKKLLEDAGYEVLGLGANINAMRNYKDLGALYLDTHGASFKMVKSVTINPNGSSSVSFGDSVYALQTSTEISASTLITFKNELESGRVVVSVYEDDDGAWQAKLAITEKFIARNWSFDDGVVMLHACFGGSGPFKPYEECNGACFPGDAGVFDPTPLRQAIIAAGADAVISFDHFTNTGYAKPSILYFYDRMLGADQEKRKNPPLRPFKLSEVWQAMGQENLLTFRKPKYASGLGGNDVNLTQTLGDSTVSLAPSIKHVDVIDDAAQNQGKLEIAGHFGDKQGKVEVDGLPASIESWSKDKIVAKTAFSGPGAAGELVVKAPNNVESNALPITEWIGTLKLTLDPNKGSLKAVADTEIHFRADVHAFREAITGAPKTRQVEVYVSPGSHGAIQGSGSYTDGNVTQTWSGGGSLDIMSKANVDVFASGGNSAQATVPDIPTGAGDLGGLITLNPATNQARMCYWILGGFDVSYSSLPTSIPFYLVMPADGLTDSKRGLLGCIDTTLREDYSIPGGSRTWTDPDLGEVFRLEWSAFEPVYPPDENTPA